MNQGKPIESIWSTILKIRATAQQELLTESLLTCRESSLLLESAHSLRNQICHKSLSILCMFSAVKILIMLLLRDDEISMHVMKAEIQIKIQGEFCYVESQLCCYTITFLEPRFIYLLQAAPTAWFMGLLLSHCISSQTTDYCLIF